MALFYWGIWHLRPESKYQRLEQQVPIHNDELERWLVARHLHFSECNCFCPGHCQRIQLIRHTLASSYSANQHRPRKSEHQRISQQTRLFNDETKHWLVVQYSNVSACKHLRKHYQYIQHFGRIGMALFSVDTVHYQRHTKLHQRVDQRNHPLDDNVEL